MRFPVVALLLASHTVSAQTPWWQRVVVLPVEPGRPIAVQEGIDYLGRPEAQVHMDVYRPKGERAPLAAVLLVHGGPITSAIPVEARRLGQYLSLGSLIASRGLVAVTFSHRLTGANAIDTAAADVRSAFAYIVAHASELRIDASRLCVWAISGGGILVGPIIHEFGDRVRCFVSYYNVLTPSVFQDFVTQSGKVPQNTPSLTELITRDSLRVPPTFVVRAGKDNMQFNADIDNFVGAALRRGTNLELHAYAEGQHAFDIFDDTAESRDILRRTLAFLQWHLARR